MSYPGQPGQWPGQPQQPGFPQQPGYPQGFPQQPGFPQRPVSNGTATLAAICGFGATLAVGFLAFRVFSVLDTFGFDHAPTEVLMTAVGYVAAALILLAGACVTLARKSAGPVLVIIGAVITLADLLLQPMVYSVDFLDFLKHALGFAHVESVAFTLALAFGVLALLFAMLPSTFAWTRSAPPAQQQQQQPMGHYPPW